MADQSSTSSVQASKQDATADAGADQELTALGAADAKSQSQAGGRNAAASRLDVRLEVGGGQKSGIRLGSSGEILGVNPGMPAEAAGLRVGDVIIAVDHVAVGERTAAELLAEGKDRPVRVLGVERPPKGNRTRRTGKQGSSTVRHGGSTVRQGASTVRQGAPSADGAADGEADAGKETRRAVRVRSPKGNRTRRSRQGGARAAAKAAAETRMKAQISGSHFKQKARKAPGTNRRLGSPEKGAKAGKEETSTPATDGTTAPAAESTKAIPL